MSPPTLGPEDEDRVIAALVALDWMEFPFDTARETIGTLLGCSTLDPGETAPIELVPGGCSMTWPREIERSSGALVPFGTVLRHSLRVKR